MPKVQWIAALKVGFVRKQSFGERRNDHIQSNHTTRVDLLHIISIASASTMNDQQSAQW